MRKVLMTMQKYLNQSSWPLTGYKERFMERCLKDLHNGTHDGTLLADWNSAKENKPVKPVKEHWKSGIQPKFLDVALQKKCQT